MDKDPLAVDWFSFLETLASKADGIALRYFRHGDLAVDFKLDRSLVSVADREIEDAVRHEVSNAPVPLGFFGEESGETDCGAGFRLICDPIDGTENFVRGIPIFATLLAIEYEGNVICGMVSAPALMSRWHASIGQGAFFNGVPCKVSSVDTLSESHVFYGSLFGREAVDTPDGIYRVLEKSYRQRGVGDFYSHMLVAMGCGEIALDFGLQYWDRAPIGLIVGEAGGACSDRIGGQGYDDGSLICSNGRLHDSVIGLLNG